MVPSYTMRITYFAFQEAKPVSDWQLLKLNAPEWPYLVIGSIAAFLQGACFPAFALLFGFTSGVRFYVHTCSY